MVTTTNNGIYMRVPIWGFPKIRGTFLGVTIIRTIVFWGLCWGPLILGELPYLAIIHLNPKPSRPKPKPKEGYLFLAVSEVLGTTGDSRKSGGPASIRSPDFWKDRSLNVTR